MSEYLLLLLMAVALLIMLFIKCLGKCQEVYQTVRSWFWLLAVLWLAFILGRYGVATLGMLMSAIALWELWRVIKVWTWRDGLFVGCIGLFGLAWVWVALTVKPLSVLLFVLFAVQVCDVCQYLMGRAFGHRLFVGKLAPNLSPNKTIEGAVFGVLLMMVLSLPVGRVLTDFGVGQLVLLAVSLGACGIVGDLLESSVKRRHQVKDMGVWLAGHGGLLDRMDSLLVSVPLFAVLMAVL